MSAHELIVKSSNLSSFLFRQWHRETITQIVQFLKAKIYASLRIWCGSLCIGGMSRFSNPYYEELWLASDWYTVRSKIEQVFGAYKITSIFRDSVGMISLYVCLWSLSNEKNNSTSKNDSMRWPGIEPGSSAWKAEMLLLHCDL